MKEIVARFAPSPTGFLHIGGIRTALINYIYIERAKLLNPNSKLLLRIEDTDKIRSDNSYVKSILNGLKWIGIKFHGEAYIQSKNADRHKKIAFDLLKNKNAFKCICSQEKLQLKRNQNLKNNISIKRLCDECENDNDIQSLKENYCIRIKIPSEGKISINDKIQGLINIENKEIDNFILIRNDGTPTYMLSVVVDDHDMGGNSIIRGDDHLNNTFRQLYIYNHLKWDIPEYYHLPLIYGNDGSKLSKRHGAVDINEFKNKGYLPEAIINNLILLGWSANKDNEIIEIDEIIKIFEIKKLSKSPSIFDYKKLNFFNNYFLQKDKNLEYFIEYILLNKNIDFYYKKDKEKMKRIFEVYKKKIDKFSDLEEIIKIYYDDFFEIKSNKILDEKFDILLKDLIINLDKIKIWDSLNITECLNNFVEKNNIKFILLGKPLRLILINDQNGPSINEILCILGKKNTFIRLNKYINKAN